jgi:hypothetical protein
MYNEFETKKIFTGNEMFRIVNSEFREKNAEIELLKFKQKIAVKMVKELLDFLEFIYNHPEFENSLKAYEWIMLQIEMIMAKYNEPVGEER